MLAATVSLRVFEAVSVVVFAVGVLLGIVVGWQSRGHLDRRRRGGYVGAAGVR